MRILSLLLWVVLTSLGKSEDGLDQHRRAKRESLSRSKRRWVLSTIDLQEEVNVEYPYKISAMFNDKTKGKKYEFQISGEGTEEGVFSIDKETGDVYVHMPVDREEKDRYHITFDVWDIEHGTKIDRDLSFDVEIKDINDNKPVFKKIKKEGVKENTPLGERLPVSIEVTDNDEKGTINSTVVMTVSQQEPAEPKIGIKNVTDIHYQLILLGCFDYDKAQKYTVTIHACDLGIPPLCTDETVELNIIDTNSHQPRFKQRQYEAEAVEMQTLDEILRVAVEDKDTPNTDGWRAKYNFISGNEDGIYKITTDPKTNEGIISVIKEKNFDKTTLVKLQIGVKNIEPLTMCKDGKLIENEEQLPPQDTVNITVKMIDGNDAPIFQKYTDDLFQTEEKEPGQDLYTPVVHDIDSSNFRFELVEDPAKWVTIDEKTGKITTIKKMDRESPFVDENSIYRIVFAAIDDGTPPATSTSTINVHLRDINDNTPTLLNKSVTFCANRDDKVMVSAKDPDAEPFSGPFSFSLPNDESVTKLWKLDPSYGEQVGIAPYSRIPFDNHSVPIVIQDKQNQAKEERLFVVVCECDETGVCNKYSQSTRLGKAAIGLIISGFLGFLTALLFLLVCSCAKVFKPIEEGEGSQKLMNYNQEAGCTDCMSEPTYKASIKGYGSKTDTMNIGTTKNVKAVPPYCKEMETITSTNVNINSNLNTMDSLWGESLKRNTNGFSRHSTWSTNRRSTLQHSKLSDNLMNMSQGAMYDILRYSIDKHVTKHTEMCYVSLDLIKSYQEEEDDNSVLSQEEIVDNNWNDLKFLDSLGPKFKTLQKIIESSKAKSSRL